MATTGDNADRQNAGLAADPGTELSLLVKKWRERLDPDSIPGLVQASGRHKTRVSQEDMAGLIGVSVVWYRHLERGDLEGYSDDFLDRASTALRLNEEERNVLYLYAVGKQPAQRGAPTTMVLTEPLQRVVRAQPYPAYISDESWDVVAYNEHMANWFPWIAAGYEGNIMRWVFTYPDARQQLHKWETDWAPLMLAQMRVANARQPDNMRLATLIREILERSDFARELWERGDSMVYVHPDGDHRQLHLPYHRKVIDIELVALSPMRAPGARVMMLLPLDGNQ